VLLPAECHYYVTVIEEKLGLTTDGRPYKQPENFKKIFIDGNRGHNSFKSFTNDTYRNICNDFGICSIEEQIFARQGKFTSRYCAAESDVCKAIGHLR